MKSAPFDLRPFAIMGRWLSLNRYALALDAGVVVSIGLALLFWSLTGWWWLVFPGGFIGFSLLGSAVRLHGLSEHKHRSLALLIMRNRLRYRPETFELYMRAPCGRVLVRHALQEIGRTKEYATLRRLYPSLLWVRTFNTSNVTKGQARSLDDKALEAKSSHNDYL